MLAAHPVGWGLRGSDRSPGTWHMLQANDITVYTVKEHSSSQATVFHCSMVQLVFSAVDGGKKPGVSAALGKLANLLPMCLSDASASHCSLPRPPSIDTEYWRLGARAVILELIWLIYHNPCSYPNMPISPDSNTLTLGTKCPLAA